MKTYKVRIESTVNVIEIPIPHSYSGISDEERKAMAERKALIERARKERDMETLKAATAELMRQRNSPETMALRSICSNIDELDALSLIEKAEHSSTPYTEKQKREILKDANRFVKKLVKAGK